MRNRDDDARRAVDYAYDLDWRNRESRIDRALDYCESLTGAARAYAESLRWAALFGGEEKISKPRISPAVAEPIDRAMDFFFGIGPKNTKKNRDRQRMLAIIGGHCE